MNRKLLLFSGFVTMLIGTGLGAILATLLPTPYRGGIYLDQRPGYMLIGATGGFLFGVSIEAMRELKEQRDRKEERDS
jgi:Na+-transporting NADH:ubiquinone oxidoreductase subunit NqrD